MAHVSVLLPELVEGLALKEGDTAVDATINGGGHSLAVSHAIGRSGTLVGIDLDRDALQKAGERLAEAPSKVITVQANFRDLKEILQRNGIEKVDAVYFDLGLSSNQFEESHRGFSLLRDEPLMMTFAVEEERNAAQIINSATEEEIADIIFRFGEDRQARKIARSIVVARKEKRITTSKELADLIEKVSPRHGKIHPATKTFQALRIAVNDELGSISEALPQALEALREGGKIGVISFHSLEDRMVKNFFRDAQSTGKGKILTKKPIIPTAEEIAKNPRARSAKLRLFEKS